MKFSHLFFCLATLLCLSCASSSEEGTESPAADSIANLQSDQDTARAIYPFEKTNFYAHYQGTLNNTIPIHLNIVRIANKVKGYYYYDKYEMPIHLSSGKLEEKTGKFSFVEYTPTQERSGSIVAEFSGNTISGVWMDADSSQQFPLNLQLSMDAYSLPLDVFYDEDVAALLEGKTETPTLTFIRTVLMPSSGHSGEAKNKIYATFEQLVSGDSIIEKGNPFATIENDKQHSIEEYRKSNLELYNEDPSFATSMNWSEVAHVEVLYNDNDLISIRQNWYGYMGGAHGNYGATNHSVNLKTGEKYVLSDLFEQKNLEEVSAIIEQKIVEQQRKYIGETTSLQDAGFYVDQIKPTENFYLTTKGIGFYYSPYEVAPYAVGALEVFVPFADLKGRLIKADFVL